MLSGSTVLEKSQMVNKADIMWAGQSENVSSGICRQRTPRSACASAQSDQGLCRPLTESFVNYRRAKARMILCAYAGDLNLRILRMLECSFSLDVAHELYPYTVSKRTNITFSIDRKLKTVFFSLYGCQFKTWQ